MLLTIIAASGLLCTKPVSASAGSGRAIDLFTQKVPFGGKGINQSSDAFAPQELVILYANVTYNEYPVASQLVSFVIDGPVNPFQNITKVGSSFTNQSGIAQLSFRIPWPSTNPERIVFGEWFALASVSIAEQVVIDTLTFQVGWLVKITNIATLNAELKPQTRFLRQDVTVFNLTVENIAMTEKSGTITIDVQDAASHPIIHTELKDLIFQPGESYFLGSAPIPIAATIGSATVSAAVYTSPPESGGVLYGPATLSTFEIITRDIAVTAVTLSKTVVRAGEVVDITVKVKNKGNETESFNVTVYRDHVIIDMKPVATLAPSSETQVLFQWNTTGVPPGNYVITATAGPVPGQIELNDSVLVDGTVTILAVTTPVYPPLFVPLWLTFFMFLLAVTVTASLFLLALLYYLRRHKKKRPPRRIYTVIVHPHI
jgi:hypothetical protein